MFLKKNLSEKYPESYDHSVPSDLVYSGSYGLTDSVQESPLNAGKLVLSPTRTYAPVMVEILNKFRDKIGGLIHCSGGAQTKVLHFVNNVHIIKDNLFELPPLFKMIHEESGTDWKEMYKVFNMGHRMEIYIDEEFSTEIIEISKNFNIEAQVIGRVEPSNGKQLTINSEFGDYIYWCHLSLETLKTILIIPQYFTF